MAILTKAAFLSKWASLFADNSTRDISETDLRDFRQDIADSFLNRTDDLIDEDDMASDSAVKVPSQQSVKAYVDAHLADTVQVISTTLSAAQIKTLVSTPVQVIAAQGANTFILIKEAFLHMDYGTVAFDFGAGSVGFYLTNSVTAGLNIVSVFNQTSDRVATWAASNATYAASTELNTALFIKGTGSDATVGDGTAKLTVYYTVIDLN